MPAQNMTSRPDGTDTGRAVDDVVHAAGGQPVEFDVAVAVRPRHDLGVEPADAEAAE